MTFEELKFTRHANAPQFNKQARVFFPNGYGASVIIGPYSYGGREGLYELAVVKGTSAEAHALCYSTPITDDVIGHRTPAEVTALLQDIEALPPVVERAKP